MANEPATQSSVDKVVRESGGKTMTKAGHTESIGQRLTGEETPVAQILRHLTAGSFRSTGPRNIVERLSRSLDRVVRFKSGEPSLLYQLGAV